MSDSFEMVDPPSTREEFATALETLIHASAENGLYLEGDYPVWDDDTERVGWDVEVTRIDRR